ncbi:MAG: DUF423 domain-containing protein [Bacteroidia bacterium]|nr:DUF423 domain-containing protein [Bacteroidia bacterium]
MQKRFLVFSGFSGALSVILGAMAAHYLESKLDNIHFTLRNLQTFETAAKYQMYHSIALLGLAFLFEKFNSKMLSKAGYCFMAGIVLFSGSLYFLSTAGLIGLTNVRWLGPITPIGGLFFIAGWVFIALSAFRKK